MVKLSRLKLNPDNPRRIKDERYFDLLKSLKEFPEMMALRPLIIDKTNVVIGGNNRLRALKELAYKEIPDDWVKKAHELNEEQRRRFIIQDNNHFGEYDYDILANSWDAGELTGWGLEIPGFNTQEVTFQASAKKGMRIKVECDSLHAANELFERLQNEGFKVKLS